MNGKKPDDEKARHWEKIIREAACCGMSIRRYCRRRNLTEKQFYWWRRRLGTGAPKRTRKRIPGRNEASFALVSDQSGTVDAGIELLLADGRRLRICKGVDEETLRAVLAAVES